MCAATIAADLPLFKLTSCDDQGLALDVGPLLRLPAHYERAPAIQQFTVSQKIARHSRSSRHGTAVRSRCGARPWRTKTPLARFRLARGRRPGRPEQGRIRGWAHGGRFYASRLAKREIHD